MAGAGGGALSIRAFSKKPQSLAWSAKKHFEVKKA
jgi:hypothetical protein